MKKKISRRIVNEIKLYKREVSSIPMKTGICGIFDDVVRNNRDNRDNSLKENISLGIKGSSN